MNASQLALSDAPATSPPALYKSNARSLSSIARSYSRAIIATLLRPLSASGLSPSSSARSRQARAVSQSAAAIARSPPRSRSSRAWTPMAADHLIRATDQPANPAPWASGRARSLRESLTRASNSLGSDRRRCCFAPGAVVSAEPDEMLARDEVHASGRARSAPASLLHPWNSSSDGLTAPVHAKQQPAPDRTTVARPALRHRRQGLARAHTNRRIAMGPPRRNQASAPDAKGTK